VTQATARVGGLLVDEIRAL